jgi:hypothetical protein
MIYGVLSILVLLICTDIMVCNIYIYLLYIDLSLSTPTEYIIGTIMGVTNI